MFPASGSFGLRVPYRSFFFCASSCKALAASRIRGANVSIMRLLRVLRSLKPVSVMNTDYIMRLDQGVT